MLRIEELIKELARLHPDARCSLDYKSPFELLVATVLSAQCTDERVNKVTPSLFKRFPNATSLSKATPAELEELIRSTGFYRAKAKSLLALSKALVENHKGQVPETLEELTHLRGVGRKTANVVLGNCFGIPGITVDTHVGRLARRMGMSRNTNPVKVERDLMKLIPQNLWTTFSHQMIYHGRRVCTARDPRCDLCPLSNKLCPKRGIRVKPRK